MKSQRSTSTGGLTSSEKWFSAGDSKGFLGMFKMLNGALLFDLKGHSHEIRFINFSEKFKVLVSFDSENVLNIHSYGVFEEPKLMQSICLGAQNFNAVTIGGVDQTSTSEWPTSAPPTSC